MELTFTTGRSAKQNSNKILIKGLITGLLILIMLIPTLFVSNLITEREQRQKEVVEEVSSKWAAAQRVSGPYIVVPYTSYYTNAENKIIPEIRNLILLPETINLNGNISPEIIHRSIYKVLLYRSGLSWNGTFNLTLPKDITADRIDWINAKLCIGITDFKGIEEKIKLKLGSIEYELMPGLPSTEIDSSGLSSPITVSAENIGKPLAFSGSIKIKGSEQLHFLPLAANSQFNLNSSWPNPSFDGNVVPASRTVDKNGFTAKWLFNQANLPFGTVIKEGQLSKLALGFGLTMLQPADQYAKTMRSVKYAILFIGLTFALFFIIELLQQKPFHPVQYILVGIALVIFYTLLLSISEFLAFDLAYIIASLATILLITFYAKGHFKSWKVAGVFLGVLAGLYGFIFILISLEDTALLVGSIGLFIVLALVMNASRKINWYGHQKNDPIIKQD
jgi:inner membrane protein